MLKVDTNSAALKFVLHVYIAHCITNHLTQDEICHISLPVIDTRALISPPDTILGFKIGVRVDKLIHLPGNDILCSQKMAHATGELESFSPYKQQREKVLL